jgi:hypothetical protein
MAGTAQTGPAQGDAPFDSCRRFRVVVAQRPTDKVAVLVAQHAAQRVFTPLLGTPQSRDPSFGALMLSVADSGVAASPAGRWLTIEAGVGGATRR